MERRRGYPCVQATSRMLCWQLRCREQSVRRGGVMVWAAINYRFKTQLVVCQGNLTARCYIDQDLRPVVVLMFRQRWNLVYQHDNARPHVARATWDFLQANNIGVLPWPACSPDWTRVGLPWTSVMSTSTPASKRPATDSSAAPGVGKNPSLSATQFVRFHETSPSCCCRK